MKYSLMIELSDPSEIEQLIAKLQGPVPAAAPVTPSTPVAPPVASPVAAAPASRAVQQGEPTPQQLEEAMKKYGRDNGFDKAAALLAEYTTGRLGSVPAEKRAELYARLAA